MCSSDLGSLLHQSDAQLMLLHAALRGCQGSALSQVLIDNLSELQRQLRQDGEPLQGQALTQEVEALASEFERVTLPQLRRLQAVA